MLLPFRPVTHVSDVAFLDRLPLAVRGLPSRVALDNVSDEILIVKQVSLKHLYVHVGQLGSG